VSTYMPRTGTRMGELTMRRSCRRSPWIAHRTTPPRQYPQNLQCAG